MATLILYSYVSCLALMGLCNQWDGRPAQQSLLTGLENRVVAQLLDFGNPVAISVT